MYDPTIGRWTTTDPIGFEAADANLYRYVGNSPPNATDPSGLAPPLEGPPLPTLGEVKKAPSKEQALLYLSQMFPQWLSEKDSNGIPNDPIAPPKKGDLAAAEQKLTKNPGFKDLATKPFRVLRLGGGPMAQDYFCFDYAIFREPTKADNRPNIFTYLERQGYKPMEKPDLSFQPGFEKVVLYQRPDRPIPGHAAIQLPNGKWRSKLSWDELIEHDTAEQLVGTSYGGIHQVWIRPINWDKWLELIKKR